MTPQEFNKKYPHLTKSRIAQLWEEHEKEFQPENGPFWWVGYQKVTTARKKSRPVMKPLSRVGIKTSRKARHK